MALSEGNVILASDFIAIKARVKAECARRKYNGSVEAYAGSSYDYTIIPQDGKVPLPEHFNKIIVPMNAMVNTGRSKTQNGYVVRAMNDIDTALTKLEGIAETAKNGGCKSSCTGLCQGTCASGCTSCTGSCTNACTSCTGGCTSCSGNCSTSCAFDGCSNGCDDSCAFNCSETCANNCKGTCKGGCLALCKGTCKGATMENPID